MKICQGRSAKKINRIANGPNEKEREAAAKAAADKRAADKKLAEQRLNEKRLIEKRLMDCLDLQEQKTEEVIEEKEHGTETVEIDLKDQPPATWRHEVDHE